MFMPKIVLALVLMASAGANAAAQQELAKTEQVEPEKQSIELAFVGDVMMDWSVKKTMSSKGVDYPFVHIKEQISAADYATLNLETAVTTSNSASNKQYTFKSDPAAVQGLVNSGFDLVSLANNHTMDFGQKGLLDTFSNLTNAKLPYIGAGKDAAEAFRAHTVTINEKKISFLAFSRVLPSDSWYAGDNKPGIASGYQLDRMVNVIKEVDKVSDYVIVNIHWGKEKVNKPLDYQRVYAQKMIDAGADGIIGHHPHVLQGFEYYKEKPIAYSLGNFLFPDYVSGKTAETGILTLQITDDKLQMFFNPYYIKKDQIVPLSEKEQNRLIDYLNSISFNSAKINKFVQ